MTFANTAWISVRNDANGVATLPRSHGVYVFQGDGALPLYIGKSVDIRARVMSHLRAPDEATMMAQTRRIDVIETAGEIGALLLEARMIKAQSPLYNQRLRRLRTLCSIRLQMSDAGVVPQVVHGPSVHLGVTPGLYGLFSSQHAAQAKLRELAQQHLLCLSVLGLEKAGARGCFGVQIKTCLGACIGKEDRRVHDQRLLSVLQDTQVQVWPFAGAIDLVEACGDWVQRHRVNNWCYVGTQCSRQPHRVSWPEPSAMGFDMGFDVDSYKILVKPIMLNKVVIEPVTP